MEEYNHLNDSEKLKAENEFLKMKLMLEHGAHFGGDGETKLPTELENEFLKNVMTFERQYEERKTIKLFDKIGQPRQFKPVNEIPDSDIDKSWKELGDYLSEHGVNLDFCSPNISTRELYRFTIEELFEHEMDDMNLPGWSTNFIYDEFHPDPVYDNTRAAKEDCINYILEKRPMEWTHHFRNNGLRLNQHTALTIEQLKNLVNQFKLAYDNLEINEITDNKCMVNNNDSWVTGTYSVTAVADKDSFKLSGNWEVIFELDADLGYWYIKEVDIDGINF